MKVTIQWVVYSNYADRFSEEFLKMFHTDLWIFFKYFHELVIRSWMDKRLHWLIIYNNVVLEMHYLFDILYIYSIMQYIHFSLASSCAVTVFRSWPSPRVEVTPSVQFSITKDCLLASRKATGFFQWHTALFCRGEWEGMGRKGERE